MVVTSESNQVDGAARSRRRVVKRILKQWRSQLIDVSAANRLLYYRDLKVAAIDLSTASDGAVAELLAGSPVRAGRLWPDGLALASAVRSLKAIAKPARVYAEEFGLQITFIASGFASWLGADGAKEVNAPVLLRQLRLHALPGAVDAFELEATEDGQLNPVLVHLLAAEHGIFLDEADLLEAAGGSDEILFARLTKCCEEVLPGFRVLQRAVAANFAYASQAMVADLSDENVDFLSAHDMVAALAGDPDASDLVQLQGSEVSLDSPDHCPPSSEHLILDADGSQSYVINAIVNGQHLVVQGPPGTGKTQTITNTIAKLVVRGKTVLFVAQKRAAITAVLDRLEAARLDGLLLDLFDGANSRRAIVQQLGAAIESASVTARPKVESLQMAYAEARDLLVSHRAAMHESRSPWAMSLLGSKEIGTSDCTDGFYDLALRTKDEACDLRLGFNDVAKWHSQTHEELRRVIQELFSIGGLDPTLDTRPGWAVSGLPTIESLRAAEELVARLADTELQAFLTALHEILNELALPAPRPITVEWCIALARSIGRIEDLHVRGLSPLLESQVIDADALQDLLFATGDKEYRRSHSRRLGRMAGRRLRRSIAARIPDLSRSDLHRAAVSALELRTAWRAAFEGDVPTSPPSHWQAVEAALDQLVLASESLRPALQGVDLKDLTHLGDALRPLRSDRSRFTLPRINSLRARLVADGCEPVVTDLLRTPASDGDSAANRLSQAFASTVIEHLDQSDERLAGFTSADLLRATDALIAADEKLRDANASRVRRSAAERLISVLDANPSQAAALRGQVKRKRGFLPMRRLVDDVAPDVILAAKPIWAASPQTVSQLLPTRVLFDVVLFDEASQVLPAAAIPSMARGRQVVVAGDDLQLPPTTLFTRTAELEVDSIDLDVFEEGDEAEPELVAGKADSRSTTRLAEIPETESILDALSVKLGPQRSRYLAWHYRSRDEKLIATSNSFLYRPRGRMMTTFPAADSADALAMDQSEPSTGLGKTNLSPIGEVRRVVDLMMEHAAEQTQQASPLSLGVIAFGVKHAARIEREFEERVGSASPDIQKFFSEESREQYFIKNIERVQGDERDVILLSIGYAKGADGKLRYNWGPVLSEGGYRRVNVAITRARHKMRLVTSFDIVDVDPQASSAEGFALMYRFLRFAASNGTDFGDEGAINVPCNVFEADIQSRLENRGLRVIPQWGVGGYRLDFAVQHPRVPGSFLLAVEADGASYHSGLVARERDRLRQQQLEARGWRFVRIWSSDYFFNPEAEIDRVVAAYEEELAKSRRRWRSDKDLKGPAAQEAAAVPDWQEAEHTRGPRPAVQPGLPISHYSDAILRRMAAWVLSDDLPRTQADTYEIVKRELGFLRDGKNIVQRITAAVEAVTKRGSPD